MTTAAAVGVGDSSALHLAAIAANVTTPCTNSTSPWPWTPSMPVRTSSPRSRSGRPWRLVDGIEHESGTRSTFFATNAHHTKADVDVEISCRDGVVALCGGKVLLSDADGSRAIARDSQSHG